MFDKATSFSTSPRLSLSPSAFDSAIRIPQSSCLLALERLRVVAREPVEGDRLFPRDAAHVVSDFGGVAGGEDFVETFERADEPFGQARRESALAELRGRDGGVSDASARRLRELRGNVVVRERRGAREDVSLPLMSVFGESARGDRRDVA